MKQSLLKKIQMNLALLSTSTFVLSPLAQAQQSLLFSQAQTVNRSPANFVSEPTHNFTAAELKKFITESRVNKKQTFAEFVEKNKADTPPIAQEGLAVLLKNYGSTLMPQFEVQTIKDNKGKEIPVIRISSGDEFYTMAFYGEEDRYVKFENVNLTKTDIVNFTDMYERIFRQDLKLRKKITGGVDPLVVKAKSNFSPKSQQTPAGLIPDVDEKLWKSWSQKERAAYIVNLRLLWASAQSVLAIEQQDKTKKAPVQKKKNVKTSSYQFILDQLLQEAIANDSEQKTTNIVYNKDGRQSIEPGKSCIVAGYVSQYDNKNVCQISTDSIKKFYNASATKNQLVHEVLSKCGPNEIACNPYIYGTPNGKPICISTQKNPNDISKDFNRATHLGGPCEKASSLGVLSSSNDPFANAKKDQTRYKDFNEDQTSEEIRKIQAQPTSKLVENFLDGLVKLAGDAKLSSQNVLDDNMIGQIKNIKNAFDSDISQARNSCKAATETRDPKQHEKNFYGACDQLHRRYLHVVDYVKNKWKCPDGSTLNENIDDVNGLMCDCSDKSEPRYVKPGTQACTAKPPAVVPPVVQPPQAPPIGQTESPPAQGQPQEDNYNPCEPNQCKGKTPVCEVVQDNDSGAKAAKCVAGDGSLTTPEKPSFWSKLGGWFKQAAIIGVGIFAMYKLVKWLSPKPAKVKAVGDCGTTTVCTTTCTNKYQAVVNGVCQCAQCAPTQTLVNSATCSCGSSSTSSSYLCPDSLTYVTSLSDCPSTTSYVTCSDGSTATSLLNCPSSKINSKVKTNN